LKLPMELIFQKNRLRATVFERAFTIGETRSF